MRYGSMVTGGCLALLSLIRLDRGDVAAAMVLATVAVVARVWGATGATGRRVPSEAAGDPALERAHGRTWRRITLLGLVVSVVGAFTFPPMALVVGALTVYSASRMRRSSRILRPHPAG